MKTKKQKLILRLKGISREMKAASKLSKEVYTGKENRSQLLELSESAKIEDSWVLEINEEIKDGNKTK